MPRLENGKFFIDEPAEISRHVNKHSTPDHTHGFIELVYTVRGKCIHTVDGKRFIARHGDMIIINYNQSHAIEITPDSEYINILLKPEIINESIKNTENSFSLLMLEDFEDFRSIVNQSNCFISFNKKEQAEIESILEIAEDKNEKLPGDKLLKRSALNILFIFLFRKMSLDMQDIFDGINSTLLSFIKENCEKKLSIGEISRLCGYESTYFCRLFKSKTGKTFTEYLYECRIEKSRYLLENTDMPVEKVMLESGFSNRTKFFKAFSSITGCTPLVYKKTRKNLPSE